MLDGVLFNCLLWTLYVIDERTGQRLRGRDTDNRITVYEGQALQIVQDYVFRNHGAVDMSGYIRRFQ